MTHPRTAKWLLPTFLAATAALACSRPGGPGVTNEFGGNSTVLLTGAKCLPLLSGEIYPARRVVTHPGSGSTGGNIYFTSDLWQSFGKICGGCHVTASQGGWQVTQGTFFSQVTETQVQQHILTDDPAAYMPPAASPNGGPFSQRDPDDPVRLLADLLQLWISQGSPAGQFYLSPPDGGADAGAHEDVDGGVDAGGSGPQGAYSMTPDVGATLTNLGTCLPNRYVVGTNGDPMDRLDAFFAQAAKLPDTLAETDLTTLDSDTLARNGVVSYVPAYPLWSDSAGKMRYVRVPHGQPIVFDKTSQTVPDPAQHPLLQDLPQADHRRRRQPGLPKDRDPPHRLAPRHDGRRRHRPAERALRHLHLERRRDRGDAAQQDPLRNGLPFSDRLITYITDEAAGGGDRGEHAVQLESRLRASPPPARRVRRHYAVPGSERCIAVPHGERQRVVRARLPAAADRHRTRQGRAASSSRRPATS